MSWTTVYKFAWGLLAVIAIIALICLFLPKVYHFQDLQAKRDEIRRRNEEKQAMIEDRRRKQEKFRTDPEFVERTAREMGMVKPNETVFKFTNGSTATVTNAP